MELFLIDSHAPLKTIRVKGRRSPWISAEFINLFKQRDKAWLKRRASKDPVDWEIYRYLRNLCKTKTRNAQSDYYKDSFKHDFHNPRQFWKKLNHFLHKNKSVNINNETISDPLHLAHAFNNHYSTICAHSQDLNSYITTGSTARNIHTGSFSFKKKSLAC